jgi:uncharacterized protein
MNINEFTLLILAVSLVAGFLGALTGLGGGVVIVPLLTLVFKIDIRYAIGATLISVIATSSGAAAAYVKEGYTNIRVGMFLEIATTIGALVGASLAVVLSTSLISFIFGIMLIYSAYLTIKHHKEIMKNKKPDALATRLKLDGTFPTEQGIQSYHVYAVPQGFGLMGLAGVLSGLLGIGSGVIKVLAMDQIMQIPFKVSTTTSNFMIGVTAAASAGIYFSRGYIDPGLAMPVMLGVLLGSMIGARVLVNAKTQLLRMIFAGLIFILAIEMIYTSVTGAL